MKFLKDLRLLIVFASINLLLMVMYLLLYGNFGLTDWVIGIVLLSLTISLFILNYKRIKMRLDTLLFVVEEASSSTLNNGDYDPIPGINQALDTFIEDEKLQKLVALTYSSRINNQETIENIILDLYFKHKSKNVIDIFRKKISDYHNPVIVRHFDGLYIDKKGKLDFQHHWHIEEFLKCLHKAFIINGEDIAHCSLFVSEIVKYLSKHCPEGVDISTLIEQSIGSAKFHYYSGKPLEIMRELTAQMHEYVSKVKTGNAVI